MTIVQWIPYLLQTVFEKNIDAGLFETDLRRTRERPNRHSRHFLGNFRQREPIAQTSLLAE